MQQLEWTVNSYNLSFAVLMITGAVLGDRYGRRRFYAVGMALFVLASAACALAPDAGWLIAARTLQGAGAALLAPLSLTLVASAFPAEKRGAAIGAFSAITGIAVAAGPTLGGAVINGFAWEWIFWLNVPIGLIAIPLVLTRMQEGFGSDTTIDTGGLLLVSGGAFGIVWGLVRGNPAGWDSAEVLVALVAGVGADRRIRGLGATYEGADAADALLPVAVVHGEQRGDLLHDRVAVLLRVLLPAAPAGLTR